MIKNGTGHCWDPIPVNNYDIVIAGTYLASACMDLHDFIELTCGDRLFHLP